MKNKQFQRTACSKDLKFVMLHVYLFATIINYAIKL